MNLPDPDDPHFKAEARELGIYLLGAVGFVLAFVCLVIAYLT